MTDGFTKKQVVIRMLSDHPTMGIRQVAKEVEVILRDKGFTGRAATCTPRWVAYIKRNMSIQNPADVQHEITGVPTILIQDGEPKCSVHRYKGKNKPPDCPVCQQIWENAKIKQQNLLMAEQIERLRSHRTQHQLTFANDRIKVGYVTDTHLGSLHDNLRMMNTAYDLFANEGITLALHSGDLLDGEKMYPGHEYEIRVHGADNQIQYAAENYPFRPGIVTKFITGNHDLSFHKNAGVDIGKILTSQRPDLEYLGQDEADLVMETPSGKAIVRLTHPGGGTAYAISYKSQKYIEALSGGEKPNIVLMGHFHKAECLPMYRNVCSVQGGTLQSQTRYMRSKNSAAHVGFWIIEFNVERREMISRFRSEFYAMYG